MHISTLRVFRWMNFRHIRQSKLRSAIVVASIAAGVSLTVAPTVVVASMRRSPPAYARGFSGPASLTVIGPIAARGLSESPLARVAATAGGVGELPLGVA